MSVIPQTKIYEKPTIERLKNGLMNKFGFAPSGGQTVRTEIEGVAIDDLVRQYGSPLFVFSEREIRERCQTMKRTFATRYPNVQLAWSYKTNYLNAVCAIMHEEGSLAEVVSEMEYDKARALGVPGERILYNGPLKSIPSLERAVREGASIHIDHEDEIEDLEDVTERLGKKARVAIRLNVDAGIHPQWSRFGFNLESGEATRAVTRLLQSDRLMLAGVHCHIGTFILEPAAYSRQIVKMIGFMYAIEEAHGVRLDYLDIGGGLPSQNRLKNTYLPSDIAVPEYEEYAAAIGAALLHNLRPGHTPKLILEPGRAMIDEAGTLISTVHASKRLADGTRAYVLDAGVNLLFTSYWYRFNLELDRYVPGIAEPSKLYGPLCMNIDVIEESVALPPLPRGTRVVISPVGAYNVTQWMQFIQYRPNVVMITAAGAVEVIRVREDLAVMNAQERTFAQTGGVS